VIHSPYRFSVIGTSGSGKSIVAAEISRRMTIPHIELDALHWRKGWREAPEHEFRQLVDAATKADAWVADGNYHQVRDIIWLRAGWIVWLDLPFPTVFWRTLCRTLTRFITHEELWNENVEGLRSLFGPDAMPLWVLRTYWRRKKEYPQLLLKPEYSHLHVIHLQSQHEVRKWLESLRC
jgi:adenylate kinase family enzyme